MTTLCIVRFEGDFYVIPSSKNSDYQDMAAQVHYSNGLDVVEMIDDVMSFLYNCCIPIIPKLFEKYKMDYEYSDYLPTVYFQNYGQSTAEIQFIRNPFKSMIDREILKIVPIFKYFLGQYKKIKQFKGFCETLSDLKFEYRNDFESYTKLNTLGCFLEKIKPFNSETLDMSLNEFWFEIKENDYLDKIPLKKDVDYVVRYKFLTSVYSHIKKRLE